MADLYWVNGSGNWSDALNHWSLTDGGAPGAGNLPTVTDDVHFTALSNATAYTVTINAAGTKACRNMSFEAAPAVSGTITLAGSTAFPNVTGSITMLTGMVCTYSGQMSFTSTTTGNVMTWNGVTFGTTIVFNGVGGEWTFADNRPGGTISMLNGSLNLNGKTVAATNITHGSGTFTLTTGAAMITVAANFSTAASGFTLVDGTATWVITDAITNVGANTLSFGHVSITNSNSIIPAGLSFASLTHTPTAQSALTLTGDTTITGALTLTGFSAAAPVTLTSASVRNVSAGSVVLTDVAFMNITAAGATIPWSGTRLVNLGGNTNIDFGGVVTPTKVGGDDVPYRKSPHKGWNREEWRKRVKDGSDSIEQTLRETYDRLTGKEAPISVLARVDEIVRPVAKLEKDAIRIDWTKLSRDFDRANAMMRLYLEEVELQAQMEEEEELLLLATAL